MHSRHELATPVRKSPTLALALLIFAGMEQTRVAAENDPTKQNKEVVQAAFDTWRKGTGGAFDLLAPDAKWTIVGNAPVSRTYTSRQEFMDFVIVPFNARLSSRLIPTLRGIYADGDMVIALFDAEAMARDGKPYRNTYTWYMRMREGRITEVVAFFDTIEFADFWSRIRLDESANGQSAKCILRKYELWTSAFLLLQLT
jgi:ketosteroid isomerase-like protein